MLPLSVEVKATRKKAKKSLDNSSPFICEVVLSFSISSLGARSIYAKFGTMARRKAMIPGIEIDSDKFSI